MPTLPTGFMYSPALARAAAGNAAGGYLSGIREGHQLGAQERALRLQEARDRRAAEVHDLTLSAAYGKFGDALTETGGEFLSPLMAEAARRSGGGGGRGGGRGSVAGGQRPMTAADIAAAAQALHELEKGWEAYESTTPIDDQPRPRNVVSAPGLSIETPGGPIPAEAGVPSPIMAGRPDVVVGADGRMVASDGRITEEEALARLMSVEEAVPLSPEDEVLAARVAAAGGAEDPERHAQLMAALGLVRDEETGRLVDTGAAGHLAEPGGGPVGDELPEDLAAEAALARPGMETAPIRRGVDRSMEELVRSRAEGVDPYMPWRDIEREHRGLINVPAEQLGLSPSQIVSREGAIGLSKLFESDPERALNQMERQGVRHWNEETGEWEVGADFTGIGDAASTYRAALARRLQESMEAKEAGPSKDLQRALVEARLRDLNPGLEKREDYADIVGGLMDLSEGDRTRALVQLSTATEHERDMAYKELGTKHKTFTYGGGRGGPGWEKQMHDDTNREIEKYERILRATAAEHSRALAKFEDRLDGPEAQAALQPLVDQMNRIHTKLYGTDKGSYRGRDPGDPLAAKSAYFFYLMQHKEVPEGTRFSGLGILEEPPKKTLLEGADEVVGDGKPASLNNQIRAALGTGVQGEMVVEALYVLNSAADGSAPKFTREDIRVAMAAVIEEAERPAPVPGPEAAVRREEERTGVAPPRGVAAQRVRPQPRF